MFGSTINKNWIIEPQINYNSFAGKGKIRFVGGKLSSTNKHIRSGSCGLWFCKRFSYSKHVKCPLLLGIRIIKVNTNSRCSVCKGYLQPAKQIYSQFNWSSRMAQADLEKAGQFGNSDLPELPPDFF